MPRPSEEFLQSLQAAFDAVEVGQGYTFRRTFTEGDVTLLCGVTGDYNPYHLDETFAQSSWFGRRIVPGLLTASMVTHIGGMLGFLATSFSCDFLAPVYPGDTVTCTFTVTGKDSAQRRVHGVATFLNQNGENVLRAEVSGIPGKIRLIADNHV